MLNAKKIKSLAGIAFLALMILSGCSNNLESPSSFGGAYGSLTVSSSRSVYVDDIKTAVVTVKGYDLSGKAYSVSSGVVPVSAGSASGVKISKIPVSTNAVVEVQSYSDASAKEKIDGIKLYAVTNIAQGNNSVNVNWNTSAKGVVYSALYEKGNNLGTASLSGVDSVVSSLAADSVHSSLIDSEGIAEDFPSLKVYTEYIIVPATITVNAENVNGVQFCISDPLSEAWTVNGSSKVLRVAPGTWKIYAIDGESVSAETLTVSRENTCTVSLSKNNVSLKEITVFVPKSAGYSKAYAWAGSVVSASWPGDAMQESGDYYVYGLESSTTKIIFNEGNGNQTNNLYLKSGCWEYIGGKTGTEDADGSKIASNFNEKTVSAGSVNISVGEVSGPVVPSVKVPVKAYLGETFEINVTSNVDLISSEVTIGGKKVTLSNGKNVFNVSDFTSTEKTLSVSGSVKNSAGSTAVSGSIVVTEKPANTIVSDWNELRIYQVMVASFQDGDSSRGYTQMWGPDNALKGGDLQGIINAIPYIKDLGINALWMTPVFESNGDDKLDATGYFAQDYFNIDHHFGTMETFDELVTKCHENGIAVILDGVFGHNKGSVTASPNRNGIKYPGISPDGSNPVNYASNENSLKYYSDVASYWITEHKIDGWRFDQCYQVGLGDDDNKGLSNFPKNTGSGGHNYWYDIRKVIESAAASNGTKGQDWGTLGYMVGEHWNGNQVIIQYGSVNAGYTDSKYGDMSKKSAGYGLNGCFDFPSYYQLVQGFAQEWGGKTTGNIGSALSYTYSTYTEKGYSCKEDDGTYETYYPNLMLSNHDLYRVGDLINKKHNDGFESDNYAKRNMVLLAAQGAYSGPITIYYGDEIGDHNATTAQGAGGDNIARSTGKITGFNSREQKIHDFEKKVLTARSEHPALWKGSNEQIEAETDFYVSKKQAAGETIYVAFNYNASSAKSFSATGTDLLTGTAYNGTVTVPALSAVYLLEQ